MTSTIQLKQLSQSAQAGGYWLISGEVSEPITPLAAFYSLQLPSQTEHACSKSLILSLFGYQFPKLHLLSTQPLEPDLMDSVGIQLLGEATLETALEPNLEPSLNLPCKTEQACLLLGSDLGIGPLFYRAKQLKNNAQHHLALLHTSAQFPFVVKPAHFMLNDFPFEAIGGCSLLEDWKIANRLASDSPLAGCFEGSIIELLMPWIEAESQRQLSAPLDWQILSFLPETTYQTLSAIIQPYPWLSLHNLAPPPTPATIKKPDPL